MSSVCGGWGESCKIYVMLGIFIFKTSVSSKVNSVRVMNLIFFKIYLVTEMSLAISAIHLDDH